MTKVSVLGETPKGKEFNKIELLYHARHDGLVKSDINFSGDNNFWDNIILIQRDYENDMDLILCFNGRRICGTKHRSLMLGHWNDGVV